MAVRTPDPTRLYRLGARNLITSAACASHKIHNYGVDSLARTLVESGLIKPGAVLTDAKRRHAAIVRAFTEAAATGVA